MPGHAAESAYTPIVAPYFLARSEWIQHRKEREGRIPTERSNWVPEVENRNKPVYLAIADAIADDIRAGKLPPGQRLPPQRLLAGHMGIDFTTVPRLCRGASSRTGRGARGAGHLRPRAVRRARCGGPESSRPTATARIVDMTMNQPPLPDLPELGIAA